MKLNRISTAVIAMGFIALLAPTSVAQDSGGRGRGGGFGAVGLVDPAVAVAIQRWGYCESMK